MPLYAGVRDPNNNRRVCREDSSVAGSREATAEARSGYQHNFLQIVMDSSSKPADAQKFHMTTCIDTIEIYYPLSHHEVAYVAYQLDVLTHAEDDCSRKNFLSTDPDDPESISKLEYSRFYRFVPGITRIKLYKYREKWIIKQAIYRFKIFFWLKPELLVTGKYSLQLFRCSPSNFYALQEAWATIVQRLFSHAFEFAPLDPQLGTFKDCLPPTEAYTYQNLSRLPYLGLCRIERLDVTNDIVVADPVRFEELALKSFQDSRQLKQIDKSYLIAESPGRAIKVYDKQKELREQHTRSPNLSELLQDSAGVIRIEYSIKKPDRDTLKRLFDLNIPSSPKSSPSYLQCGLIPFFFEDYGDRLLLKVWQSHISTAPWLSKYHVNKAIEDSRAWQETKRLAKDVSYVISRKRSLNEGREAYVKGVEINGKEYKGTAEDFDRAVRFLRKIGVQPLRIPQRWKVPSQIEADFRKYPSIHVGPNHIPGNQPGIPSAQAEIYEYIKTKLIEIYKSYKPRKMRV